MQVWETMLMISKTTRNMINSAITQELNQAHKAHGRRFATPHEGYGVLMEEIWEARLHTTAIDNLSEQLIGLLHSVETHPGPTASSWAGSRSRLLRPSRNCVRWRRCAKKA